MNRRTLEALTSWPYLLCLFVLLLNDWVLKNNFPGLLTGKLSDFAGLVVVALPLFAVVPNRAPLIYGGIICVFLWWKSPASDIFIELVNSLGNFHFGRTVDYSDLFALGVLPLCHAIANSLQNYLLPWHRYRKIIAFPIGIITMLAILGTSSIPLKSEFTIRSNSTTQELSHDKVAQAIKAVALKHDLKCHDCSHPNEGASYIAKDNLRLEYSFPSLNHILFRIFAGDEDCTFGLFCSSSSRGEKLDALSRSLKREFSTLYRDMEYVEQLDSR